MKKIVLAAALFAFVGSSLVIAGGDKEKDKKACSKKESCCSKKKDASCDKKADKKTEETPK